MTTTKQHEPVTLEDLDRLTATHRAQEAEARAVQGGFEEKLANPIADYLDGKRYRKIPEGFDFLEVPEIESAGQMADKGGWQANARIVRENMDLFTGKRIIAIATKSQGSRMRLNHPDTVKRAYGDGFEFIEFENSQELRETLTFLPLMEHVESTEPNEATFYCHSKGCTKKIDDGATPHLWRDAMYETLLNWPAVESALRESPIVGSFRKHVPLGSAPWHYSGTFFWFRNADVFTRDWRNIDQEWTGVESWPGKMFPITESGCVFADRVGNLYDLEYWKQAIEPELERWKS